MLPLRDVHKPKRPPLVTRLLLLLNIAVFGYQLFLNSQGRENTLVRLMGVRPHCYFNPDACHAAYPSHLEPLWQPLLVSLFLHGGALHLAFNMLFLWVFGPNLEDRLGRWRYGGLYLGCGLIASAAHIVTHPTSMTPVIGASGAIAGVLGAYLILLPRSWILTYLPPVFLFPVPAPLFLIAWIAGQVAGGFSSIPLVLPNGPPTDVAWMSHLGGFTTGALIGWLICPWWKRPSQRAAQRPTRTAPRPATKAKAKARPGDR